MSKIGGKDTITRQEVFIKQIKEAKFDDPKAQEKHFLNYVAENQDIKGFYLPPEEKRLGIIGGNENYIQSTVIKEGPDSEEPQYPHFDKSQRSLISQQRIAKGVTNKQSPRELQIQGNLN